MMGTDPPALTFGIGDRVIHTLTKGRIRGRVTGIHLTAERTMATVVIDGLNGRDMTYDARNLAPEPSELPSTPKETV